MRYSNMNYFQSHDFVFNEILKLEDTDPTEE